MAGYESSGVQGRLTTPLVRVDGVLRPTTWDIALDAVDAHEGRGEPALDPGRLVRCHRRLLDRPASPAD